MSTVDQQVSATTVSEVVGNVHGLAPTIAARADEIEADRRLPSDLLADLTSAGCFRVLRPTTHGGMAGELPATLALFETLARTDASVAWIVMIGASSWIDLAGLPRASFDALYADHPDALIAGAFSPSGSIRPTPGGYRVAGRWGFASGCEHSQWLYGNCVEGIADGGPQLRIAVLRPDMVTIEDTWNTVGLAGTGSHHFRADVEPLGAEWTLRPLIDPPCIDAPIVRVPVPAALSLAIASIAAGIAHGALDDLTDLAADKVPLLAPGPLAASPSFHHELASADTTRRAASALLAEVAQEAWATAVRGDPLGLEQRARIRAAALWATDHAAAVVDRAYRSGGGSSPFATSPLQRRLRDVHTLTQHFLVRPDTFATAGSVLAGQGLRVPVF